MKFRLAGVLRARQAQESVAKAAAARSRVGAEMAHAQVHRQAASLDAACAVHPDTATALAMALTARQAMAATLSAAISVAGAADVEVSARIEDLAAAAAQRKVMDKLAERHAVTQRRHAEAAERAELDDLVAARHVAPEHSAKDSA